VNCIPDPANEGGFLLARVTVWLFRLPVAGFGCHGVDFLDIFVLEFEFGLSQAVFSEGVSGPTKSLAIRAVW
jgi:hypothetical protein